jgi:hypothetical protein
MKDKMQAGRDVSAPSPNDLIIQVTTLDVEMGGDKPRPYDFVMGGAYPSINSDSGSSSNSFTLTRKRTASLPSTMR